MTFTGFVREILDSGPRHDTDAVAHMIYVLEHERSELDKLIERLKALHEEGLSP